MAIDRSLPHTLPNILIPYEDGLLTISYGGIIYVLEVRNHTEYFKMHVKITETTTYVSPMIF